MKKGIIHVRRQVLRQSGKVVEAPLKTKNSYRNIAIGADTIDVLKGMDQISEYVFPSPYGSPMSPDSVLHMLQRRLKRAGLERIRFHELRHTYVTNFDRDFVAPTWYDKIFCRISVRIRPLPALIIVKGILCRRRTFKNPEACGQYPAKREGENPLTDQALDDLACRVMLDAARQEYGALIDECPEHEFSLGFEKKCGS